MLKPLRVITLICGLLFPLSPDVLIAAKVPRVGVLLHGRQNDPQLAGFRRGLRELGYIERKNVVVEYKTTRGNQERIRALATDLTRLEVDVIVTGGTLTARTAQRAAATVPIVFAFSGDPVGTGLVASLARPGGNVTGLSMISAELSGKRLELLKEAALKIRRVGVLWDARIPDNSLDFGTTQATARTLRLELQSLTVRDSEDLEAALPAAVRHRLDALLVISGGVINVHPKTIMACAARNRLPVMHETLEFAEAGGLMAYGVNVPELFRRSASYVDEILKGARPADLPVQRPMEAEFIINLKAAARIALAIPPEVLYRADKVIK